METIKSLERKVGTLSITTKIPAPGFSTSAFDCKMGKALSKIEGSVCKDCYAKLGNNLWANVKKSYKVRKNAINKPYWVPYMVDLIKRTEHVRSLKNQPTGYFRWFNSGDLASLQHLAKIVEIAKQLPKIKFWLPTKEYKMVHEYLKFEPFPKNLCVRLSAYMIDQKAPNIWGLTGSGVVSKKENSNCNAYMKGHNKECGSCRKCWDNNEKEIYYPWHKGRKVGK